MDESTLMSRHPGTGRVSGTISAAEMVPDTFSPLLWALVSCLVLLLIAPPTVSLAQIVTNITPTQTAPLDLGTDVNTVGTTTQITGGTRPANGTNLFHSFDFFTLGTSETARFMNDMQRPTNNIFGRVIGGEVSEIDGTLQTNNPLDAADPMNFGTANLWLVNPSGLLLGPNARVDVGGSVSMSTANYLRFEGTSALFDMLSTPASLGLLNVAPVVAFGFTGPESPAPITVQGSMLQVPEGQSLSLVGGDITLQAETFEDGTMQAAILLVPGGQLNLLSVASPGEVLVPSFQTGPNINGTSFTTMGTVTLKEGATLDVSGQLGADADGNPIGGNSGTVFVRGGQLVMDASTILASTVGAVDGERTAIDIQVSQDVTLTNGAAITTQTFAPGRGGDILITAGAVKLTTGAGINSFTFSDFEAGAGGDISLNVNKLTLMDAALIQSQSQTFSPGFGQGGNVTIQGLQGAGSAAESVSLSGASSLSSQTLGNGDGGRVAITSKSVVMDEGAFIDARSLGEGRGGDIVVAVQQVSLSGGAIITSHTDLAAPLAGAGGTVAVQGLQGAEGQADSLTLAGQDSGIRSTAFGEGRLGDIAVRAKTVSLTDGAVIQAGSERDTGQTAGDVTIDANLVGVSGGSRIASQVFAADAGQVTITADVLTLDNGSIETDTVGVGRGGDVALNVGTVSLLNSAKINSSTSQAGRAGDVTMNVGTLSLAGGSSISSASIGTEVVPNPDGTGTIQAPGTAGNVAITATGGFTSDGSTVATSAEANHGGDVSITAQSVQLSNGNLITANSNGPLEVKETVLIDGQLVEQVVGNGNAGNITVRSGSTFVMNNSSMTTEASQASGGQITIITPEMIRVINGQVSTSVAGSEADTAGGNILIDPQFVVLQNGQIIAQAVAGEGGDINIIAGAFLADPGSLVSASSQRGISGVVNIQAQIQNLGEQLTPLSEEFSSAAELLAQQCAARVVDGKFSTFVVSGREGLPVEPGGYLASPSLTAELLGSHLSGRYLDTPIARMTGAFSLYDAKPIQLAKVCRMVNGE